jgi:hypothetical protein
VFLLWDAVVLGLVPFVVKHEDSCLVSIKDSVDNSFCLTYFRIITRLAWERLSLNPSSWYGNHLEASVQRDTKRCMWKLMDIV